nr:hypothetical protein Iba_chr13cCG11360 [Ipomoea batatas]GME01214.1 hypothetical protein Iba_contig1230CG0010 [Ipomoea batatas]
MNIEGRNLNYETIEDAGAPKPVADEQRPMPSIVFFVHRLFIAENHQLRTIRLIAEEGTENPTRCSLSKQRWTICLSVSWGFGGSNLEEYNNVMILHMLDLDAATVEINSSNINTMSVEEDEIDTDGDDSINDDDEIPTTEDEEAGDDD